MSKKNIQLLIFAWGEKYEEKIKLLIESILNDLTYLNYNQKILLLFFIDDKLENLLKKNVFIKLVKKRINFKVVNIDNKIKTKNFFNNLQEYAFEMSRKLKSEIIIPIYADFIFFNKSLRNVVDLLVKKNKKIIFQPVLCLVEELVFFKIRKLFEKKTLHSNKLIKKIFSLKNIHNIQKMMLINNNKLCLTPAWNIYYEKNIYINSFHNTPIAFKTELLSKKIQIHLSSDQDFTNSLFNNLKFYSDCYFVKNSSETLIVSLKSKNDQPLEVKPYIINRNNKYLFEKAKNWIIDNMNNFHRYSANYIYILNINNNKNNQKIIKLIRDVSNKLFY